MKQKLSITIEEEKIKMIEKHIENGIYRNKSHVFEQGLNLLLKETEGKLK